MGKMHYLGCDQGMTAHMKSTDIGVWSCGRTSSSRCPNKMLRSFHDTTLTDILLTKLAELQNNVFFAGFEPAFQEKCEKHKVPFVQRTQNSATVDQPASEIYNFLESQPYELMLHINACVPFLRTSTIVEFLERCVGDGRPCFGVFKRVNYFTFIDGTPINWPDDLTTINTKSVSPVYEFAHVFYFFERKYFVENGWFWNWKDVRYIEIPGGLETFDIDDEEEFLMAETLWRDLHHSVE